MIAIISDLHSNEEALKAVLKDINDFNVKEIYCLGDIVNYGPDPNTVIQLLIEHRVKSIMGNHDYSVIDPVNGYSMISPAMQDSLNYTLDILEEPSIQYLKSLTWTRSDKKGYFVHCCPPDRLRGHIREYIEDYTFKTIIESTHQPICFVGHTHQEMIYAEKPNGDQDYTRIHGNQTPQKKTDTAYRHSTYTAGDHFLDPAVRYIINAGSVGFHKSGSPHASYCLFDPKSWRLIYRHVRYDLEGLLDKLKKLGLTSDIGRFVAKYLPIDKLWAV